MENKFNFWLPFVGRRRCTSVWGRKTGTWHPEKLTKTVQAAEGSHALQLALPMQAHFSLKKVKNLLPLQNLKISIMPLKPGRQFICDKSY